MIMKVFLLKVLTVVFVFNVLLSNASADQLQLKKEKKEEIYQKIDTILNKLVKKDGIPGIAIGVSFADGSAYLKGYGKANLEFGINTEINTVFEIGSLTKTFTGVGILLLQEEGKLDVSDHVSKYFPQFPNGEIITIKHLLQHTSGLKDVLKIEPYKSNRWRNWTPQEVMKMIESAPLEFDPGQRMKYSNSGCYVLGLIIERVSGMSFENFMTERIAKPLGMKNTMLGNNSKIVKNSASSYALSYYGNLYGELKNAEYSSISAAYASGGAISTVQDFVKLKKIFKPGVLLSEKSIKAMCSPTILNDGKISIQGDFLPESTFGYCLDMVKYNGHFIPGKSGSLSGFTSYFAYFPDSNTFIVIFCNRTGTSNQLYRTVLSEIPSILKLK
jgi:CubicO group peptidase (beta-lactamase class C family)